MIDLTKPLVVYEGSTKAPPGIRVTKIDSSSTIIARVTLENGYKSAVFIDTGDVSATGTMNFRKIFWVKNLTPIDWTKPIEYEDGSPAILLRRFKDKSPGGNTYCKHDNPFVVTPKNRTSSNHGNYYDEYGFSCSGLFGNIRNVIVPEPTLEELAAEWRNNILRNRELRKKLETEGFVFSWRNTGSTSFNTFTKIGDMKASPDEWEIKKVVTQDPIVTKL